MNKKFPRHASNKLLHHPLWAEQSGCARLLLASGGPPSIPHTHLQYDACVIQGGIPSPMST
eukprot:scaffold92913_cov20-Tisochrysis_lutea.AAC.2